MSENSKKRSGSGSGLGKSGTDRDDNKLFPQTEEAFFANLDQGKEIRNEDYDLELAKYREHLAIFQDQRGKYEKILNEYKGSRADYTSVLNDFLPLSSAVKEARTLYDADLKEFQSLKRDYEEGAKKFVKAVGVKDKLDQIITVLRKEREARDQALTEITHVAKKVATSFEEKSNQNQKNKNILTTTETQVQLIEANLASLTPTYKELSGQYEAERPKYTRVRNDYDFASQVKKEVEDLSAQVQDMQVQENQARKNFEEIAQLFLEAKDEAEIASQIDAFTSKPLENIDEAFQLEKEKYQDVDNRYRQVKASHDEASGNFARIEKNYKSLKESSSANRVALHYVAEEFQGAKAAFHKIDEKFQPLAKAYSNQSRIYQTIKKNYKAMKEMVNQAKAELTQSQEAATVAGTTRNRVEETYNFIGTQNAILKQSYATKQIQFQEMVEDYSALSEQFQAVEAKFLPIDKRYQEIKQQYDKTVDLRLDAKERLKSAQAELEKSNGDLQAATVQLAKVHESLESRTKAFNDVKEKLEGALGQIESADFLVQNSREGAGQQFAVVSQKRQRLVDYQEEFSSIYSSYNLKFQESNVIFDRAGKMLRLANEEYASISAAHQSLKEHYQQVDDFYGQVLSKYKADKAYHDEVYAAYNKLQASREDVLAKKQKFDLATQALASLLVQKGALTFPIYEATGQNYVDAFNLPEVVQTASGVYTLKDKPLFTAWVSAYERIHAELGVTATALSAALKAYQESYDTYKKTGGPTLAKVDGTNAAYLGVDIAHYMAEVDKQVGQWEQTYGDREHAFAMLVSAYGNYLERENQLTTLILSNTSTQQGVQEVLETINAIPDYADIYGSSYSDIGALSARLGVSSSELIHPKSAASLVTLFKKNYKERTLDMIRDTLGGLTGVLKDLRKDYESSISKLEKALQHFEITTGISTQNIQVDSILNQDIDFEKYLTDAVNTNFEKLQRTVQGISSAVNAIKRAEPLNKVANRVINTTVDNTLVLPDQPITMEEALLDTELTISNPKVIGLPVEPESPVPVPNLPEQPIELGARLSHIEYIQAPDELEEFDLATGQ